MKVKPINPRWLAFVDELMADGNATHAYIAAGNHPKDEQNAAVSASKLIRNPKVAALIAERQALLAQKHEITVDEIVGALRAEAMDRDSPASARIRAWQLLGEHLGVFGRKVDVTAWIREMAIREGMDPDEAVREAQAILDSQKGK